jgi:uncharacterized paraquat-inducible protein A
MFAVQSLGLNVVGADQDYIGAHEHCWNNRPEVKSSSMCGCFKCIAVFPPNEIDQWGDRGITALCPRCGVNSVIGSASGYPITADFLETMRIHWFRAGGIKHSIAGTTWGVASVACLAASWLLLLTGAFRVPLLGLVVGLCGPVAVVLAICSLLRDNSKDMAVPVLVISILNLLLVASMAW